MGRAVWGILLALVGSLGLTALVWVANCGGEACQKAMFGLGLAGASLASAVLQVMVLVGLWLLWTANRSR